MVRDQRCVTKIRGLACKGYLVKMANRESHSGLAATCGQCCYLCRERLRRAHSHGNLFRCELLELYRVELYTGIVSYQTKGRGSQTTFRRALSGKYLGDFASRWPKHRLVKERRSCSVPRCDKANDKN